MTSTAINQRELSEKLANLVSVFHQNFVHQINMPLPSNQFLTLIVLKNHGTMTVSELSTKLLISKQQMSPITERLSKAGYIKREQDQVDRRNIKISLLESGLEVLQNHQEALIHLVERKISSVPEEDLVDLDRMMKAFFKIFGNLA